MTAVHRRVIGIIGALAMAAPSLALADPCKAIPDNGPLPTYLHRGAKFSGRVVYIGDGDSLCVATGLAADTWVEVRLADFYAPEIREPGGAEAKATLSRLTFGRTLTCQAGKRSYDRVIAVCYRDNRSVGELMREAEVREGGRGTGAGVQVAPRS